ncbi:MAG: archease [Acidobacteriota bacterium]
MSGPAAGHREIEHTADLGFDIWAPDLPGLYSEAVGALAELCYDRIAVLANQQRTLRIVGGSNEERLVRWLQEIYFWLEAESWLAAGAVDVRCDGAAVSGTVLGELYDSERHTVHTEIKAITYHEMEIRLVGELWRTTVIIDV